MLWLSPLVCLRSSANSGEQSLKTNSRTAASTPKLSSPSFFFIPFSGKGLVCWLHDTRSLFSSSCFLPYLQSTFLMRRQGRGKTLKGTEAMINLGPMSSPVAFPLLMATAGQLMGPFLCYSPISFYSVKHLFETVSREELRPRWKNPVVWQALTWTCCRSAQFLD